MDTLLGYPPDSHELLTLRVGRHIGARLDQDSKDGVYMRCPACGGADFGPTLTLENLGRYEDGYLPGAPLLHGVCLDCEHITTPNTDWGVHGDPRERRTADGAGRQL